jgi:uracil-DNA glycosylase
MNKKPKISTFEALDWYSSMEVDDVTADDLNFRQREEDINRVKQSIEFSSSFLDSHASLAMTKGIDSHKNPRDSKRYTTLEELKTAVMNFDDCDLKKTATNTVFGDGALGSKIMIIGEAPGAEEDETGIPFCGDSGKLLDNMLASIGLSRQKNVYITNTIFWRPPANRRPTKEEIAQCRLFVEQHIALIKPKLLILVGSTAVTALLGPKFEITKIRQEYYSYNNAYLSESIATTALFHPAYLMRQPSQKKQAWYDLLKIKDFIAKNIAK